MRRFKDIFFNRLKHIMKDSGGETLVEVLVAFTLLSIMLLIFSQGLAWATKSEANAAESRDNADQAMIALQDQLANNTTIQGAPVFGGVYRYIYHPTSGTTYVVYKAFQKNGG